MLLTPLCSLNTQESCVVWCERHCVAHASIQPHTKGPTGQIRREKPQREPRAAGCRRSNDGGRGRMRVSASSGFQLSLCGTCVRVSVRARAHVRACVRVWLPCAPLFIWCPHPAIGSTWSMQQSNSASQSQASSRKKTHWSSGGRSTQSSKPQM